MRDGFDDDGALHYDATYDTAHFEEAVELPATSPAAPRRSPQPVLPESRTRIPRNLFRASGLAVTFLVGPAAALVAANLLGMGMLESTALLVLVSGWLGPKLIQLEAR